VARLIRAAVPWLIGLAILAALLLYARDYVRKHPQDVPWTPLRLDDPIGRFTLRKLVALSEDPALCRALLAAAGSADDPVPPRIVSPDCGYADGMRLEAARGEAAFSPAGVTARCPVAAALLIWERQVLQPAAERHFGQPVARIENAGSFSCRRVNGRSEGRFSEHATANAIDITGFALVDGTRISVIEDWPGTDAEALFLRDVRDGACALFATILSPEYNAAHSDHLHFDQAARGKSGFGVCG
jgi:hypothetical protein